jgi:hypothetical protein
MIIRKYYSWKDFLLLLPSLMIVEALTFGYAIKCGWKGILYKCKAIKDGLTIKVNKCHDSNRSAYVQQSREVVQDICQQDF